MRESLSQFLQGANFVPSFELKRADEGYISNIYDEIIRNQQRGWKARFEAYLELNWNQLPNISEKALLTDILYIRLLGITPQLLRMCTRHRHRIHDHYLSKIAKLLYTDQDRQTHFIQAIIIRRNSFYYRINFPNLIRFFEDEQMSPRLRFYDYILYVPPHNFPHDMLSHSPNQSNITNSRANQQELYLSISSKKEGRQQKDYSPSWSRAKVQESRVRKQGQRHGLHQNEYQDCHGFYCRSCHATIPPQYRPFWKKDQSPETVQFYKKRVRKQKKQGAECGQCSEWKIEERQFRQT